MDETSRQIITMLLSSAEQMAIENMILRETLQGLPGFHPKKLVPAMQNKKLRQAVLDQLAPLRELLSRPEDLLVALQDREKKQRQKWEQ
jgi:hypothetical protein